MIHHIYASYAQKSEADNEDASPVPLGSRESHDPPIVKFGRWLRAKSLHSIMNEDKNK
ncbi:hypothetical protein [Sulfolobus sp. S-194]|uniref:hypothetical protein n=1 Tax=Sulfolobus sp. S-194 TaxID=2512240 RepID=UPI00143AC7D7|nr:hypothetical protein [Sulfolobus sp. S-194]